MKIILLFALIILTTACGGGKSSNGGSSTNSYGQKTGTLSIPAPGIVGGGPTLLYGNSNLQVSNSSQNASQYINQLDMGQINVAPISQTSHSTAYRVRFVGSIGQGPCPFNPMAICGVVSLDSIQAY